MSNEIQDATRAALRRLALRDRTELEVQRLLQAKGFSQEIVKGTLERLKAWGYLNDVRVAMAMTLDRLERSGWGPARVKQELARRGVDPMVVSAVVAQVMEGRDEEGLAKAAARRYVRAHPGVAGQRGLRRLAGYLGRRGYSAEVIARVIKGYAAGDGLDIGGGA